MKKVTFQFKSGRHIYYTGDIVDRIANDLGGAGNHVKYRGWIVRDLGGYAINMDEVEYVKFELTEENE